MAIGVKKSKESGIFKNYSCGVRTNRDAWCYNASKTSLVNNMERMISFYNAEAERFEEAHTGLDARTRKAQVKDFINTDPKNISWADSLKSAIATGKRLIYR